MSDEKDRERDGLSDSSMYGGVECRIKVEIPC
jgi:hypothetical protein